MRGILLDPATGRPIPDLEQLAPPEIAESLRRSRLARENGPWMMGDWPDAKPIGSLELVFRYTVTGSDKASIDTANDAPDAGSNDWTNCDLLEIYLYARTDEAAFGSGVNLTFNNDTTSGHYAYQWGRIDGTSSAFALSASTTALNFQVPGTSVTDTAVFGAVDFRLLNPTGTVGYKPVTGTWAHQSPANTGNMQVAPFNGVFESTSAVTRAAIAPSTSGKKLKVGTQWVIYKRLAS